MTTDLKWVFVLVLCAYFTCQAHTFKKRSIDLISAHSLISDNRLPKEIVPNNYIIQLRPYLPEGIFTGEIRMNLTWQEPTNKITLHSGEGLTLSDPKDIVVTQYAPNDSAKKLLSSPFTPVKLKVYQLKRELESTDYIVLYLEKTLKRGAQCELKISFNGSLKEKNEAVVRENYTDVSSGEDKWYLATKFRPNFARHIFPCFDEPAYKVPMTISIARTSKMISLSNMPLDTSVQMDDNADWFWDHFQQSPPMSTFTVAFFVSEFRYLERNTTDETDLDLKIWARADYVNSLTDIPAKVVRAVHALREFWGSPFPLPKIDIIALPFYPSTKPGDSWGLLFFRESQLDNKLSFISQEISYQWLGSSATPFWWSDAHMNYALNRYVTAYTTLKMNYKNETFNNWPMTMLYSIYYEFSKRHPHWKNTAIKQDSNSAKTEMIFRMLNYTIGEVTVVKGLQRFMTDRQYGTFFSDDVWSSITIQARLDGVLNENTTINRIASSWMAKDRLPVVNITRQYEKGTAIASQKVYLRERPHDLPDQDKLLWWIPIVMVTEEKLDFQNTKPVAWMENQRQIMLDNMPSPDKLIIVNPEEIGPFPVNYDERNWNMIAQFLIKEENRNKIPVNTRAKLLHDAWNLAYAGELCFGTALNMTLFLQYEREYVAWNPIFTMIDHIGRHIDSSDVHKKFQTYIRHLLTPLYQGLGPKPSKGESDGKAQLRRYSEVFLCQAGYRPCVVEAQKQYSKWMKAPNPDEGNIMADEYICPVFKYGTDDEWEFGLQRVINFPASRSKSERTYLLKTLAGCPIDTWKIERLLNVTVLEENGNFTDNDINLIFSMLTGGASGYTTLFNFLEKNWDVIKVKLENRKPALWNSLVTSATSVFKTQEGLDMLSALYAKRKGQFGDAEFLVKKAMDKDIKEETKWSDENLPVIDKWLDNYLKANNVDVENKSSS